MPRQGFIRVDNFEINLDRELGGGGFGTVYRAMHMAATPPMECAAKHVTFSRKCPREMVEDEVAIMRDVKHSSIISLLGYAGAADSAWIFMEMGTGGELFDRLIDSGNLSERAARPYAAGLVSAVHYCHTVGIVHRDIKLENVLLCAEDPYAVKLIDFGLAVRVPLLADGKMEAKLFHDGVGSKSYKSPELFAAHRGYLSPPVDVWALGITLFSLLSGFFPFDEANSKDWRYTKFSADVARGMGACDALFSQYGRSCPFSLEAKQMLDSMLAIDPARRATLPELTGHCWLSVEDDASMRMDEESCMYRSLGELSEDSHIPLPEKAMRITRQRAGLGDDAV